ncbi:chloride channel protein [Pararhodobacter zhoushanensis]|uniref:chloride channel protein n=1 Tax=Pararhodobacter zhoushanensis TaxID=2479545 RepID=UPI000F8CBD86|nr:chloride channel protein [Pararhodobacter zhoushanensis]
MSRTSHRRKILRQFSLGLRRVRQHGPSEALFWLIAFFLGTAAGLAALLFRLGISTLETLLYNAQDHAVLASASVMPWWQLVAIPATGGLVVGLILHRFTPDGRVRAVADVIEGAALHRGRVEVREGLASAVASMITLGSGGSAGREGPVVHLAAVISTRIADRIHANGITGRDLLGCAVAAAVSASFNAPIAGAIFAMEVVLRHYALHAFAPIAIASIMGTLVNRLAFGDVAEFTLPIRNMVAFYWEIPAYLILGLVAGLVAVALMRTIFFAETFASTVQARTGMPRWLRPAVAGALVGIIAIFVPQVIGIGYEVTTRALTGEMALREVMFIAVAKTIAVAITLGGRMGGGVFSPALVIGALTGLAFGLIATQLIPAYSGSATTYALAGMGAIAAAVLGAPVSTTLIVFELTGDWQTAIAVLAAISTASAVASRFVKRSFFLAQLARRDVRIAQGPQEYLLQLVGIAHITKQEGTTGALSPEALDSLLSQGLSIDAESRLKPALRIFERTGALHLAVTQHGRDGAVRVVGSLSHVDALRAYTQALAATAAEEHS